MGNILVLENLSSQASYLIVPDGFFLKHFLAVIECIN